MRVAFRRILQAAQLELLEREEQEEQVRLALKRFDLVFDQPQKLKLIPLVFEENETARTQG